MADGRRRRRRAGSACGSVRLGIEAGNLRAQPRVVVPQLPVRLVQRIQPPGDAARASASATSATTSPVPATTHASTTIYLTKKTGEPQAHRTLGHGAVERATIGHPRMAASKTILICDDDQGMRDTIGAILKRDYRVLTVSSGEAALTLLKHEDIDLILLDVRLPGISGFDVLRIVKENYSLVECIMISAINEVETAVQAMKHGAYHYITKNFDYDELRSLVRNACERQDLNRQVITLSAQVAEQSEREFLIGPSRQIRDIVDLVQKVAKLSATVLILGESGTGKELLARLLHRESGRGEAPFIAVNLSAIPHELVESTLFGHERGAFTGAHKQQLGKFELATGGTLFLDEIGDLRFDLQAKLLRAIQEGEIERVGGTKPIKTNFRLVVATNVDLEKAVKDGRFREDLYYRINVIPDPDAAAARSDRGFAGTGAACSSIGTRRSSGSRFGASPGRR